MRLEREIREVLTMGRPRGNKAEAVEKNKDGRIGFISRLGGSGRDEYLSKEAPSSYSMVEKAAPEKDGEDIGRPRRVSDCIYGGPRRF